MKKYKLIGDIITPLRVIKDGEINYRVEGNKGVITYVGEQKKDQDTYIEFDYTGRYIAPGFMDIHVHGGGGHDFMDGTVEAFLGAARLHAAHGTATLLPTTLTCPDEELFEMFDIFRQAKDLPNDGAKLLGLHLEGPYFAKEYKGAQDEQYIIPPAPEHYNKILEKGEGLILRWTVAPELPGAIELGRVLKCRGILPSIGHSSATYEDAVEAFESGYTLLTHFYSAMSGMVRVDGFRIPGLIESGYMIEDFDVEIIADGRHLPPSILKYIHKAKGASRVALVTDAMRGAGQTEGESILGSLKNGMKVYIEDGVAKLEDRKAFGGSVATADRLVRTMVYEAGVEIPRAVQMITMTPARMLGLTSKGVLAPGYDADFTVFDDNINIELTVSEGTTVYKKD